MAQPDPSPELGLLPLTAAQDGRAYGWLDWQISREVDNLKRLNSDAAQVAISEGKLDPDAWISPSAIRQAPFI
ncbi:hypothetical protein O0544_14570 [Edwardsiella anguillarum]|nr:hypothetical protein [Edwardsiella anguillarum]